MFRGCRYVVYVQNQNFRVLNFDRKKKKKRKEKMSVRKREKRKKKKNIFFIRHGEGCNIHVYTFAFITQCTDVMCSFYRVRYVTGNGNKDSMIRH